MPENVYFRQPTTQKMLVDILFIYCKLNPDVGYRQGMHELLAPVLWAIERDSLESKEYRNATKSGASDALMANVLNSAKIEQDTFTLFGLIMQNAKDFYAPAPPETQPKSRATAESPMVRRCRKIFNEYLPKLDPDLADHLEELEIMPQVFLMWV
jgi:TBC1 domain family member 5